MAFDPGKVVAAVRKAFGQEAALLLGEGGSRSEVSECIPTGIDVVDRYLFGVGGFPVGRIVELYSQEGCLEANTHVSYHVHSSTGKLHNSFGGTIERLYERFNRLPSSGNGKGKYQRPETVGAEFSAACMNAEGRIFHNRITAVVKSGKQECFELETLAGFRIAATANHRFFTGSSYTRLGDLQVGSSVYVHNNTPFRSSAQELPKKKDERDYLNNLRFMVVADTVASIRSVGVRSTYDISMESPHNNFVAEGFVVHNSGKTSFLLAALAGAQREGGVAILAETEQALSAERAVVMGVDLDSLVLLQPGHMEELLVQVETAVLSVPKSAGPILVGWDSIAATPTKKEVEEGLEGGVAMGERARILSLAMRKLPKLISERRCCLVLVNQIRDKLGVVFGDHTTTPGGHAVKFAASIRLQLFSGAAVKSKEGHTGKDVTFLVQKNRLVPPFRKAKVRLNYATGWSNEWSTLEHAKNLELIAEDARGKEALEEARRKLGWSAQPAAVQPMKEVEG